MAFHPTNKAQSKYAKERAEAEGEAASAQDLAFESAPRAYRRGKSVPGVKETPRKTSPKSAWRRVKKLSSTATAGSVFERESNTT